MDNRIQHMFTSYPGFVYQIHSEYYFIGKMICEKCPADQVDVTDCHFMYELAWDTQNVPEIQLYFQKLRAYSDFALKPPYHAVAVKEAQAALLDCLDPDAKKALCEQISRVELCLQR